MKQRLIESKAGPITLITRTLLRWLILFVCVATILGMKVPSHAARFMTVPFAESLSEDKWSLWQFGLYERRSTEKWRRMNRLDIGLYKGIEAGIFVVVPENAASDVWINLQYQPFLEDGWRPGVSIGVWDAARKEGPWLSDRKTGPSPFLAVSKTAHKWEGGHVKIGASYGFNRLHGGFGGIDVKHKKVGVMGEYAPENLRLRDADAWDAGIYYWLRKSWRIRASWIGGNPMVDIFYLFGRS